MNNFEIKNVKEKIEKTKNIALSIFGDKKIAGWFINIFLHYGPHIMIVFFFIKERFNLYYLFLWIFMVLFNLSIRGCIYLKLERHFFGKKWVGPYSLLRYINVEPNITNIKKYLLIGLSILGLIYIYKFMNYLKSGEKYNIFYTQYNIVIFLTFFWYLQFLWFIFI
jgi:hypothetical protein